MTTLNTNVYVVAGMTQDRQLTESIEVLDIEAPFREWK